MARLVVLLAALVGLLLGVIPSSAGITPPTIPSIAYAYGTPIYDWPNNRTAHERGPPATHGFFAVVAGPPAIDHGSTGEELAPWELGVLPYFGKVGRLAKVTRGLDDVGTLNRVSRHVDDVDAAKGGSRFAEASAAAFRAADAPASIFIKNKHLASARGNQAKFLSDDISEVQGWVAQGLRSDGVKFLPNGLDGTFRAIVPAGRAIGTRGQTYIRVIVTDDGRVINAFPVVTR